MKNSTKAILIIGIVGAGAYLWYKSTHPTTKNYLGVHLYDRKTGKCLDCKK